MTTCLYCTPEWLSETAARYPQNPKFKERLRKLSIKMAYRVKAEPAWGIDQDIIFCLYLEAGDLTCVEFLTEERASQEADYILSATPQEWKRLLRREGKFVTDFMLGKISLEQGSRVGILGVAPHADTVVEALTQVTLRFPDELTAEELEAYRANMQSFRQELGV
jgi:putative sterol carrier protein